jgi:sugar (pentulose or hexulose) kinase
VAYVIGIDGGTESLRAHVFDLSGRSRGVGKCAYVDAVPRTRPGRAGARGLVARLRHRGARGAGQAGRGRSDLALAADTTSCTVVALDGEGRSLRPALLWMDVRAHREAEDVARSGEPAVAGERRGAKPRLAGMDDPQGAVDRAAPAQVFADAVHVGEYQDYLNLRLTGRWCASLDNISIRWHYQSAHGGWPDGLLAALGLQALRAKWPSQIVAPASPWGR